MEKEKTKITVDTDKLRGQDAGEIKDRSIIVMTGDSSDCYYDDPTEKNYKDKLHTMVDMGDDREWTIEALNKKDEVTFVDCKGDDILKLYDKKPEKDKGRKKIKTKIKKGLTVKTKIWYTFNIQFEGKEYSWDPWDETRRP